MVGKRDMGETGRDLNKYILKKRPICSEKVRHNAAIGIRRPVQEARLDGNLYIYEIGEKYNVKVESRVLRAEKFLPAHRRCVV